MPQSDRLDDRLPVHHGCGMPEFDGIQYLERRQDVGPDQPDAHQH